MGKPTAGKPEIIKSKSTIRSSGGGLSSGKPTVVKAKAKGREPSPWLTKALALMESGLHNDHRKVTGEDVRFWLRSKRLRGPASPNAYGALILTAVRRGILRQTDEWRPMRADTSHGRITPVYSVPKRRMAQAA
jgi:hypothetical protein